MRTRWRRTVWALAAGALAAGAADAAVGSAAGTGPAGRTAAAETPATRTVPVGRSVRGRAITATVIGDGRAARRVLVVGCVHGNECAGRRIVAAVAGTAPPGGVQLWLVDALNPDGAAAGTRQNADGVDLNRNFPVHWRRIHDPVHDSGPRPASEPETRAAMRLIARIRPTATVWYHQHLDLVDMSGGDRALARRYARLAHLRASCLAPLPGTATAWSNQVLPGTTAFVVELPAGRVGDAALARHLRALRGLERGERTGAASACAAATAPEPAPAAARHAGARAAASAPRPPIIHWWIPFGPRRRAETVAYARRHYGLNTAALLDPRVIVEHVSDAPTARADHDIFAPDTPDPELGELPQVCAHFVVDGAGRIYQFVPTALMCRHTVGLNWTAIGIEHTGYADGDVLGNAAQLRASLALTRFLRCRYGIALRNVIGHNESLTSPYHHERVAALRTQTHGDFRHAAMVIYRRRLDGLGGC